MVAHQRAIRSLWKGLCTVIVREGAQNPDTKRTEMVEVEKYHDQPCRLSFKALQATEAAQHMAAVRQTVKLFLDPAVQVPPGSKIVVTQNGVTTTYQSSGLPATYTHHQEIMLEPFVRWA